MSEIFLYEKGDGGNMSIKENGDIQEDPTLQTLVYLSLFNGSTPLNVIREIQFTYEFEKALDEKTTIANMTRAEQKGDEMLQWMVETGLVQSAKTIITPDEVERMKVTVEVVVADEKQYITFDEYKNGNRRVSPVG